MTRMRKNLSPDYSTGTPQCRGIADADPNEVGHIFDHDRANEVGKTLSDGASRVFVEKSESHPDGAYQLTIPIRQHGAGAAGPILGAVILEYTSIRAELLATQRDTLYWIIGLGGAVVLFVILFGLALAKWIAQPLQNLTVGVQRLATADYETRVAVTSNDEIGVLTQAFNKMARDLSASHTALVERTVDLGNRTSS